MANFLNPVGRQPRGLLKINGMTTSGFIDLEVDNNTFFSADTFKVDLAAGELPDDMNAAWFCAQEDMYVEIFIGMPPNPEAFSSSDLESWIYGQVDNIDFDPAQNIITLTGRDLTRVFIDTKSTNKYPNQTSSQIAILLAQEHGLTPVVQTTTTLAGKYYEIDHVNMIDDRSEWDLLNYLAGIEDFVVYVRGQSLYFQPKTNPTTAPIYQLLWQPSVNGSSPVANFQLINLRRCLTVSRGIQVVVRSWNKKQAAGFTAKYPTSAKTIAVGQSQIGSGSQIYSKTVPNLDQEQALQYAQNWYKQLVQHEMRIENLVMPGDNTLDITSMLKLTGTGTNFDQTYFIDSIKRSLTYTGGYQMSVLAKNHSADSEIGTL